MNQILYIQKEKKRGNTIEIQKIALFFSIAIIVFGLALLGEGVYGAYKNNEMKNAIENYVPVADLDKEGQQAKIHVSHIRSIASVEYNWNDDEDTANLIDAKGQNVVIQRVDLPAGNNILNVKIIDVNGKTATYSKEFYSAVGKDIGKPEISISVAGNYVKITADDEKALSYLTYRWNEEDETKIEANETENEKIETNIEIPRGENTLTVIAVDSSNNTTTKKQTFQGVIRPTIEVYLQGENIVITVKHETGLKKIEHSLNGQTFDLPIDDAKTEITYYQPLEVGQNILNVKAYSMEDTVEEFSGQATYTP